MVTLLDVLVDLGLSRKQARAYLSTGKVSLLGVPTGDGGREVLAEQVRVDVNAPRLSPGRDLALIHHDERLVVAWKPAGLLSVPSPGRQRGVDLISGVSRILGRVLPVHRLDEQTSGLLVLARDETTQQALKQLFAEHTVERRYLAIVRGSLPEEPLQVQTRMVRDRGDGLRGSLEVPPRPGWRRPPNQAWKEAITELRRVRTLPGGHCLVGARLHTGRTHQVRIHLAERGFPVLGDPLYAPPVVRAAAPRLALHAALLGFEHPATGEAMRWEAPLADDLERLIRGLSRKTGPLARGRPRGRRRR